jgi:hypothetical protein
MNTTTVVFETENKLQAYFLFAFKEAFAVRLHTACDLESVQRPRFGPELITNIEKTIIRARTTACEKYADKTCVYVAPSSLSFTAEGTEFATGFAWVFAFFNGKLIGADFKTLKEEPEAFAERVANVYACMARLRPVIAADDEELLNAQPLISAAFEGVHIAHRLMECDYPSQRCMLQ